MTRSSLLKVKVKMDKDSLDQELSASECHREVTVGNFALET